MNNILDIFPFELYPYILEYLSLKEQLRFLSSFKDNEENIQDENIKYYYCEAIKLKNYYDSKHLDSLAYEGNINGVIYKYDTGIDILDEQVIQNAALSGNLQLV